MPAGLIRYYGSQDLHFITCSCYNRRAWLTAPSRRSLFLKILEETRIAHDFVVIGYVVMPQHIHLLLSEPETADLSVVMQVLKQRFAKQVLSVLRQKLSWDGTPRQVWETRFYDFNVWTDCKRIEKLKYIHRNPVRRGPVAKPDEGVSSSFRSYAYRELGMVLIEAPGSAKRSLLA